MVTVLKDQHQASEINNRQETEKLIFPNYILCQTRNQVINAIGFCIFQLG